MMRKRRHPGPTDPRKGWSFCGLAVRGTAAALHLALLLLFGVLTPGAARALASQQALNERTDHASVQGVVLTADGKPAIAVTVHIETPDARPVAEAHSDHLGRFSLSGLAPGSYRAIAQKADLRSPPSEFSIAGAGDQQELKLVLKDPRARSSISSPDGMEFSDTPSFTIAAVTDWTAAGGHGSDTILRTSEALAHETLALKPSRDISARPPADTSQRTQAELRALLTRAPADFEANRELGGLLRREGKYRDALPYLLAASRANPVDDGNEYDLALALQATGDPAQALQHVQSLLARNRTGDLLRLQGTLQEELGQPLQAVQSFERAVRVDPSEENYFAWGSELLLHRAILQAKDVLAVGVKRHPGSARLATSLGAALFACALYDDAAVELCRAADLDPVSPDPYEFLGKADLTAPNPLPCAEPKLAAFAQRQSDNPRALFYHSMSLWKQNGLLASPQVTEQIQSSLQRAITLDPHYGEAYLQLGNLNASLRDMARAVQFYQQAIAADPQLGEAHYRLGLAYDRLGDRESARREFQQHEQIARQQKAETERQRREIKQFLVVDTPPPAAPH